MPIWYDQTCDDVPLNDRHCIGKRLFIALLLPLSWLYCVIVQMRRWAYQHNWLTSVRLAIPVIVVGNLTVGGTGKTPLVLRLAARLRERGKTPAILTRGYGGAARKWPQVVRPNSDPAQVGDEPVLLARRSGCLVIAGPNRVAAGNLALQLGCDIVLTDDGLQHYRLARNVEIALIDGERGFGNGHCLPAGPLREPPRRLESVDLRLYHGGMQRQPQMHLIPSAAVNLRQPNLTRSLAEFRGQRVLAVAGIGYPARFFNSLIALGLDLELRPYPDHHRFTAADVAQWPPLPVLMTEKDAVKCAALAGENHWFVPVEAAVDADFMAQFERLVFGDGEKNA
ncbi:tetraacyldisaccharide 4'-kinase [Chromatium okenii]|uniref:tetraacyldisaccharide 4'-kinase n=1 Tax=Chromatium okenii TaxID=61644 RepID=UPI0026EB8629|nr:tetraacyldisaccharide 4'-kinase [Chromatium okenii]MBV5308210.1 tetraacyldisaccharide 4'-kinase [Chromatium okenii]